MTTAIQANRTAQRRRWQKVAIRSIMPLSVKPQARSAHPAALRSEVGLPPVPDVTRSRRRSMRRSQLAPASSSQPTAAASGSGVARNCTSRPTRCEWTRPADCNAWRCLTTAWRVSGEPSARRVAERGPCCTRSITIARRVGSASAPNRSSSSLTRAVRRPPTRPTASTPALPTRSGPRPGVLLGDVQLTVVDRQANVRHRQRIAVLPPAEGDRLALDHLVDAHLADDAALDDEIAEHVVDQPLPPARRRGDQPPQLVTIDVQLHRPVDLHGKTLARQPSGCS